MCGKHDGNGIDLGNVRRKKGRREGVEEEGKGREEDGGFENESESKSESESGFGELKELRMMEEKEKEMIWKKKEDLRI